MKANAQDNQTITKPVRLELLDPHPENYNTHPAEQIEGLQQSLEQFG